MTRSRRGAGRRSVWAPVPATGGHHAQPCVYALGLIRLAVASAHHATDVVGTEDARRDADRWRAAFRRRRHCRPRLSRRPPLARSSAARSPPASRLRRNGRLDRRLRPNSTSSDIASRSRQPRTRIVPRALAASGKAGLITRRWCHGRVASAPPRLVLPRHRNHSAAKEGVFRQIATGRPAAGGCKPPRGTHRRGQSPRCWSRTTRLPSLIVPAAPAANSRRSRMA